MAVKLWAFRDASQIIRTTANDPTVILEGAGLKKIKMESPGGAQLRDIKGFFDAVQKSLQAGTGGEAFVEVKLNDLDNALLLEFLTPPDPEPDPQP